MGRVIHFELTAADVERAARFYEAAFGWRFLPSPFIGGYELADTGAGDGIDGAVMSRDYRQQPAIVWVEVDDIDTTIEAVQGAGGSVVGEKNTIPGQGQVVYVRDPEGTVLGLKQPV